MPLNDSHGHLTAVEMLRNALKAENSSLKLELDDLENCLRRQNLRIVRILGGTGGTKSGYFHDFVLYRIGIERPLEIDCAHCNPRHMLVRLHHYQTK